MLGLTSIRATTRRFPNSITRDSLRFLSSLVKNEADLSSSSEPFSSMQSFHRCTYANQMSYTRMRSTPYISSPIGFLLNREQGLAEYQSITRWCSTRYITSCASIELKTENDIVRFSVSKPCDVNGSPLKRKKIVKRHKVSKKAKLNELRFYRLKAKKKMNSPNPEVRIRYKLEKAKRKEVWLIEKLRSYEVLKGPAEVYDPEILTEEEKHYLKRTGEKKKHYVPVGRRGVFGGVVLNMHLHWKKHETVKVTCKPCRPGQIHEYAEELVRLSKGIVIEIKPDNTIIFYRGKNYVRPSVMSPTDTLSKAKALEKYKYEQSLEHTSQFIEKLEKELEDYLIHAARYKKRKEDAASQELVVAS